MRRIKECISARVAFSVFSEAESKAILDLSGAEKLSGSGDMLYRKLGQNSLIRVQGVNVKDEDAARTVEFIKQANSFDVSPEQFVIGQETSEGFTDEPEYDIYLRDAGRFVIEKEKAAIGMLQRLFKIGFNRAARIMDQLGDLGVVGPEEGTGPRRVLMDLEEFENLMNQLDM